MAGPISTGVYAPAATGTVVLSGAYSGSLANLAPAAGGTLVIANNISAGTLNVAGGAYAATSPASFGPTTLQLNGGTLAAATALTGGNAIANSLVFTTTGSQDAQLRRHFQPGTERVAELEQRHVQSE